MPTSDRPTEIARPTSPEERSILSRFGGRTRRATRRSLRNGLFMVL
jgi:hypothetical protein